MPAPDWDPFATAARILDCVCAALKDEARGDDVWVGSCCVWAGAQVALDSCCTESGGQLSIVLRSGVPSSRFPTPDGSATRCATAGLAVVYEIQVARCVCAAICDCEQKELDASRQMGDVKAVMAGLNCCFRDEDECGDFVLNGFRTFGPEGGCAGSIWTITVNEPMPCCTVVPEED